MFVQQVKVSQLSYVKHDLVAMGFTTNELNSVDSMKEAARQHFTWTLCRSADDKLQGG